MSTREQRRLAAIVAADVVGYSRLMGRDEAGTVMRLRQVRSLRLQPVLDRRGGRIVKLTGDGALIEFGSAVEALSAAIEFQQAMAEGEAERPEAERLVFRVGVHLGDVIVDGDDLYGDGVNVAARLEGEAPAGGIVASGAIHEATAGRLKATFDDLGRLKLKNIERPVQAHAVRWTDVDWPATPPPFTSHFSAPGAPLPLPDKPSIAVPPSQNMSSDPEQEYFADGIVEDITTALSRNKGLFVIARNSSFTYKGKSVDVRQVGRDLGVRYVLEGSVRKAGNRLRLTGQLVMAASGTHIWADRFEGAIDDMFDLQDRMTSGVVVAMLPTLFQAEIERSRRKPTESFVAYDYLLQAKAKVAKYTQFENDEAMALLRTVAELDPNWALPLALLAECFKRRLEWGWSTDTAADLMEAARLARQAMAVDNTDPQALAFAGSGLMLTSPQQAAALLDQAIASDPNHFSAWNWRGWTALVLGEKDAGRYFESAMRLSPAFPGRYWLNVGLAATFVLNERFEDAATLAETVLSQHPHQQVALWVYVTSLALAGRIGEATKACKTLTDVAPTMRLSNLRNWVGTRDEETFALITKGLRLAGLPE